MTTFQTYETASDSSRPLEEIFRERSIGLDERLKRLNEDHTFHYDEEQKLKKVSGISNPSILANAIDLGVTAENLFALNFIPLIKVACADQRCDKREREVILTIAIKSGIKEHSSTYELVEHWLNTGYNPNLSLIWACYLEVLKTRMELTEYKDFKREIIKNCRKVAKTSGTSLMGLGPISKKESTAIKRIEELLS